MKEPAWKSDAPSVRLGRYETAFRLAQGGMAEVYVARLVGEGGFRKPVAIKRMLPHLASDERFVGMFLDEGRVASCISSPNVVSTLDLGRAEDDSLFLVMELVVGVPLSRLLRGPPVPVGLAAEIVAQAALGLHDAHEARTLQGEWLRIVHRDVSPQNVLVDVTGRVRITDFGVARAIERVTQTQSGEVKGKLAYFSPEQARAKPLDRRSDVFALAIVAWEMLAGRRLFTGEGPLDTIQRVLEMTVPRLDVLRPEVSTELADVIARALDRDVHARTESASVLAAELRAAVPACMPSELAAFVRERGGEQLRRLEEGMRTLDAKTDDAGRTSAGVATGGSVAASRAAPVVSSAPHSVPTSRGGWSRWGWALAVGLSLVLALALVVAAAREDGPASMPPTPASDLTPMRAVEAPVHAPAGAIEPIAQPDRGSEAPRAAPHAPEPSSVPGPTSIAATSSTTTSANPRRSEVIVPPATIEGPIEPAAPAPPRPQRTRAPGALRGMDDFEEDLAQ